MSAGVTSKVMTVEMINVCGQFDPTIELSARVVSMQGRKGGLINGATTLVLLSSFTIASAAEVGVCGIVDKPASFNHQTVMLQGIVTALKETTSRRGNDYTTFKLQDLADAVRSPSSHGVTRH
jgi:hypothetical protein